MKLVEIKDKKKNVYYINPNQITKVYIQKDNTITINLSDGDFIITNLSYEKFMASIS